MKVFSKFLLAIILSIVLLFINEEVTAQIVHDISKSSLIIPATSKSNYIITGTTTVNYVIVSSGYNGTITLRNLNINLSGIYSPIAIKGKDNCSNLAPTTVVDLILEGKNTLTSSGFSGCAALHVEQGAQINICAINSLDNTSGTLTAIVANELCGAGIGALNSSYAMYNREATSSTTITGRCFSSGTTAGGNIIISSGTITAKGGHGAGIGGGYTTYYDGMIFIYGGIVNATTIRHAAGIGSGCPNGNGVESCYTPNSSIIVLPPSQVVAYGAGETSNIPVSSLALAGSSNIVYIGDPAKPLVTVGTEDYEPKAAIYVDLSQDPSVSKVINAVIPKSKLDVNKIKFGTTNSSGIYQFNGVFQNNITFFTDANSSNPATLGRPYSPVKTILSSGGTVILKLLPTNLSLRPFPSYSLDEGYTTAQAKKNAYRVKLVYSDVIPMNNVVFELANGTSTDFESIQFFAADSITPIAQPATLKKGNTIYISIPLKTSKMAKEYNDVLRIIGDWNGSSTGYIRQVIKQQVTRTINASICSGNKYLFKNTYLTQSGVYRDTLASTSGADSIITLNLTVNPIKRNTISAKICSNEFYTFNGKQYNKTGVYNDSLQTVLGCDSIVTLQLTVNPTYNLKDKRIICDNELPYNYTNTTFNVGTKTGDYIINMKTKQGCDSIVTLSLKVNPTYNINRSLKIWDTDLPYNYTDTIFKTGTKTGNYTLYRKTINGCDSITSLALTVSPTFHAKLKSIPQICGDDASFALGYEITYGIIDWQSITFDEKAHTAGFSDIVHKSANEPCIVIQIPHNVQPDVYKGTVILENKESYKETSPIEFTINYPSSIILQKWNDVLALFNSSYNNGYEFSNYQWYKNGEIISGETKSYLYINQATLDLNAKYNVEVTRIKDGVKLFTCPVMPTLHSDINVYPTLLSKGDHLNIKVDNVGNAILWNVSGLKIFEQALKKGDNTFEMPTLAGTYLLIIKTKQGESKEQLIIVK